MKAIQEKRISMFNIDAQMVKMFHIYARKEAHKRLVRNMNSMKIAHLLAIYMSLVVSKTFIKLVNFDRLALSYGHDIEMFTIFKMLAL